MKKFQIWNVVLSFVLLASVPSWGASKTYGRDTAVSFSVIDTTFSKGRLDTHHPKTITLDDLAKFHGHLCDGIVVGAMAMKAALTKLFPGEPIDRTNIRVVSRSAPCLGDVAAYLTGGRFQFNTFYVDDQIHGIYVIQRIDNLKTVRVSMKKGIKPAIIDEMGAKAVKGELSSCEIDVLQKHEDAFSANLLVQDPESVFDVASIEGFKWHPVIKTDFTKTDVINKYKSPCVQ